MSRHSATLPTHLGPVITPTDNVITEEEMYSDSEEGEDEYIGKPKKLYTHLDQIFKFIGSYGRYQVSLNMIFLALDLDDLINPISDLLLHNVSDHVDIQRDGNGSGILQIGKANS